jgi:probable HAF family extracellular repeat protein
MPVNVFTTLDDPLATNGTDAFGINAMGQIVGLYEDASGNHGFLLSGGTYTTLDDPLATAAPLHSASTIWARSSGITQTPAAPTASS